jgi:hypothetical protein
VYHNPTDWQRFGNQIEAMFTFARVYFVNFLEVQTESVVVVRKMFSRSLAKPSRSRILPRISQAQAK